MSKLSLILMGTVLALSAGGNPATARILGPDAQSCQTQGDTPGVLVRVDGFKARTGVLRVQAYGSNPTDFLAKGKKIKRIDVPVTKSGPMDVCMTLPKAGRYAIAVRHDLDGNGKSSWSDGGGFSRNPRLSLANLKPSYQDVAIDVDSKIKPLSILLNYRRGLSIQPVGAAES